jgi:hypothetical protein
MPLTIAEKLAANASPKCCICAKTVYKTEEVRALNKIWHKSCFTCSTTEKNGCNKTLSIMEGYLVHDERIPYCKNCYNKNYAPKGVNAGLAATVQPEKVESAGAGSASAPPSTTASNFSFSHVDSTTTKLASTSLGDGPPKRRVSKAGQMFEAAAAASVKPMAATVEEEEEVVSQPAATITPSVPARRRSSGGAGGMTKTNAPHSEKSSSTDRVAAEFAAARAAHIEERAKTVSGSSESSGVSNPSTSASTSSTPMNSVFAAAISSSPAASGSSYSSAGSSQGNAISNSSPVRSTVPSGNAVKRYQEAATITGSFPKPAVSTGSTNFVEPSAPAPIRAAVSAPAPTRAPALVEKVADNTTPTPVVFASAVANASANKGGPQRRGSGGAGITVGGNLKKAVHKEQAAVLDGDEVDDDEWN